MSFRTECLVCGSSNIVKVIDLGMHPFADTFIPNDRLSSSEPVYPLSCSLCKSCGHVQTDCVTKPEERYSLYDYSYTSSNSEFSRNHWIEFCNTVSNNIHLNKSDFVIEIGSNDGFLCKQFLNKGNKIIGIDPSRTLSMIAGKQEILTIVGLFEDISIDIYNKYPKPKLIIANNVLNHSNNPDLFIKKVRHILDDDGFFVCEVPYWFYQFTENRFDQIYHEHVSYFTVTSLEKLFENNNMKIIDIDFIKYHGGSLRIYAKKTIDIDWMNNKIKKIKEKEKSNHIFDETYYRKFMDNILKKKRSFLRRICSIKSQGYSIICVGAAAKGNTALNFYRIDNSLVDYVTDSSEFKQGKYTPLSRIPIENDFVFAKYSKVCAIILAWNISGQLKISLKKYNSDIKYLKLG